jgi:hypothetical protein
MARVKTRYVGVYYRFAEKRVGLDGKPDKCFDILYKKEDKYIWEKIGWVSEGYTVQDAIEIRGKRVKSLRHPELEEFSGGGDADATDNNVTLNDNGITQNENIITTNHDEKTTKCNGITVDEAWEAYKIRWLINLKNKKMSYMYQKYWRNILDQDKLKVSRRRR